jgi:tetratricopeptide (TPR) repeat protein
MDTSRNHGIVRETAMVDGQTQERRRLGFVGLLVLVLLATAGCGGTTGTRLSSSDFQAIDHNQRGIKAEARGDYELALTEFAESLRIYGTIEHRDGQIVALVNSARVYRQQGNQDEAARQIDHAITLTPKDSTLFSEVAFEKARISMKAGKLDEATSWARTSAAAETGPRKGGRLNLLARALFEQGNLTEARKSATQALAVNRDRRQRGEEANSLRLLGELAGAEGAGPEAITAFEQALVIDKELGRSRMIAADLRGLARQAKVANEPEKALEFFRRACDVSKSAGDTKAAAAALEEMARIRDQQGKKEQAKKLREERDQLMLKPVGQK